MRPFHLGLALVGAWLGCSNDSVKVNAQAGMSACVTATACGLVTGGVSSCTSYVAGVNVDYFADTARITAAQVNCLAAAGHDCNAARRCLNGGMTPAPCTGTTNSCMGDNLMTCSDRAGTGGTKGTAQFDCSAVGLSCVANGGQIDCAAGSCANLAYGCDGTALQYCDSKLLHRFDCAEFGAMCVTTGVAHCRGTGPACTQPTVNPFDPPRIRCDGSVLVTCNDGQEARFDCGRIGLGCYANADGNTFACAQGNQCQPRAFSATCAVNHLSYCNDGLNASIDCTSLGFSGCDPSDGGKCRP
jgi:hypothetical protein